MTSRSVLMVDDVNKDDRLWDGPHQAFFEFAEAYRLPFRLTGKKCGVLWKGADGEGEPVRRVQAGAKAA